MTGEHWRILMEIAGSVLILWCISLGIRPHARGARLAARAVFAVLLLAVSSLLGGVGVSAVGTLAVAALGLPGFATLSVIALL